MIERHKPWLGSIGAFKPNKGPFARYYAEDAMQGGAFGGPAAYEPEVIAYSIASGVVDGSLLGPLDQYVKALKTANLWSSFTIIYPFLGGTADSTKWNLVNTANHAITWNGTMTFASTHIASNGTSGYGDCNFTPLLHMPGDSHISFYIRNNQAASGAKYFGVQQLTGGISGNCLFYPRAGNSKMTSYYYNTAAVTTEYDFGTTVGYFIHSTRASTAQSKVARNGTIAYTGGSSGDRPNRDFFICALSYEPAGVNGWHDNQYGFFTMGAAFSDADITTVNTITQTLFTALGR